MKKYIISTFIIVLLLLTGCSKQIVPIVFPQQIDSGHYRFDSITFDIPDENDVTGSDVYFYKLVQNEASENDLIDIISEECKLDEDEIKKKLKIGDYGDFRFTVSGNEEPTKLSDEEVKNIAESLLKKYDVFDGDFKCRSKIGYTEISTASYYSDPIFTDKTAYFDRLLDGCKVYGQAVSITVYDDRIGSIFYSINDCERYKTFKGLSLDDIKELDPYSYGQLSFSDRKEGDATTSGIVFDEVKHGYYDDWGLESKSGYIHPVYVFTGIYTDSNGGTGDVVWIVPAVDYNQINN